MVIAEVGPLELRKAHNLYYIDSFFMNLILIRWMIREEPSSNADQHAAYIFVFLNMKFNQKKQSG